MNIKEKFLQIKSKILKKEENNNKSIQNLIVFLILLIVTVVAINYIWNDDKTINNNNTLDSNKVLASRNEVSNDSEIEREYDLSNKIEEILKNIKGVGKVKVLITYSQTSKIMPMYSEDFSEKITEENDSRGWNKNNK